MAGALCIVFYSLMAWSSKGFVEPDEMSHFMKSADALTHWPYFLDIWGRPFCIAYYAIGVDGGITTARFLSVLASVLTAIGTIRLAQHFLPSGYPIRPGITVRHCGCCCLRSLISCSKVFLS
jgi:hypothetical protein